MRRVRPLFAEKCLKVIAYEITRLDR